VKILPTSHRQSLEQNMKSFLEHSVKITTLILILLIISTLAACSGDDSSPTSPPGQNNDPVTYRVRYDGNGADAGQVPTDITEYETGDQVTVAEPGNLTLTGHVFDGWNTAASGSGTSHASGSTFLMGGADVQLYARWEEEEPDPEGWNPLLGDWAYLGGSAGAVSAGAEVAYCQMALQPGGYPAGAFSLADPPVNQPTHQVARWNGGAFEALGGSTVLMQSVRNIFDMSCDPSGQIWMAVTSNNDNCLVYRHDADTWTTPEQMTSDHTTYQPELTFDQDGHPVLAFRYRPEDSSQLGVRHWDGALWQEYPDLQTTTDNNLATMVIDGQFTMMYANNMQYGHVVQYTAGGGWAAVGASPMHPYNSVNSFAMAADSQGQPWVVYRQGGDVHVRYFDGDDWIVVDTAALDNSVGVSSTLETMDIVLVDDVPVIAYVSLESPAGIRVLARPGDTWAPLANVPAAGAVGSQFPQLEAADDGRIFLGYRDAEAGGAMSIKVYTPED
jgi:uncharacterized repeat protein (TIGR02543 family)